MLKNLPFFLQVTVPAAIFAHKLPRRPHFGQRVALGVISSYVIYVLSNRLLAFLLSLGTDSGLFRGEQISHVWMGLAAVPLIGMSILSIWLCFDCLPKVAVLYGSCGYALQNCVYYLKRIIMMACSIDHARYDDLMAFIVFSISYVVFSLVYHWLMRSEHNSEIQNGYALAFPVCVIAINIVMSALIPWSDDTMLYCLYAFFLSLSLIIILLGAFNLSAAKVEKRILTQMIEVERKQHEVYEGTIDMINLKCHDIKQEIGVLLREENMDIKNEEIQRIQDLVSLYGVFLKTDNSTLDVVLAEKNVICQRDGIRLTCMADGDALGFMDAVDICTLFGNALDNAIEGVLKLEDEEQRFIHMSIVRRGGLVSIHMENPCCTQLRFSQGEFLSDKTDAPGFHGYGTKSIRMVAEKYGGNVTLQKIEDIFYLDILLPIPEESMAV